MRILDRISGALAMAATLALAAGSLPRFVPTGSVISPLARILDSLGPWILGVAFVLGLISAFSGLRILGTMLSVFAALCIVQIMVDHRAVSLPAVPDANPEFRLLFFNVNQDNAAFSDRIVSEALETDADVLIFTEASAMYPSFARLRKIYDFVSPCEFESCEILVASKRRPLRFWQLRLNPVWPARYAVSELETVDGKRFFLAVSHLAKPWLSGISASEYAKLTSQYDWLAGPVVAVGDFNAAPWALPMRELLRRTGMKALRWPLATWPVVAGRFGIPIDQVLVRDGVRVVRIAPFGDEKNSNHRGFVVDIALP